MNQKSLPVTLLASLLLLGLLTGCQNSQANMNGKMQSNLGPGEQDPEKFKKGVEELMAKEKAGKR